MCELVGKTQLILKRFTEPFESRKRTMLRRYDYLYELDSSEVEVDDLPMGQGETEGREGALEYSCRRVRSLRRNDTVSPNRQVYASALPIWDSEK